MTYKPFNFNYHVKVKLTEIGLKELERQHHELYNSLGKPKEWVPPKTDEDGYSSFQMWHLMSDLGHLMNLGDEPPFELNTLIEIGD